MPTIGQFIGPASCSGTVITAATSSTTILPEQSRRVQASFYNYSEAMLFLRLGTGAATNDFTVKLGSGSYYVIKDPIYTGSITGIWSAETGSLMVNVWRAVEPDGV